MNLPIKRNDTILFKDLYNRETQNNCDTPCYQYSKEILDYFFNGLQSGDVLTFSNIEVILYGVEKRKYEDRIFIIR
jgi:hypothetical protein